MKRMIYVWKVLAAVVFSAISFFVLAFALALVPVGETVLNAALLAAVGAISVICIRARSGRLAWSGCSRLVGGGACLLFLGSAVYQIAVFVERGQKGEPLKPEDFFIHILSMVFGLPFLMAMVGGFGVGAGLFVVGMALKTSAPREKPVDSERP